MLLKNKRGLVLGIANDRSIAYAIANIANQNGAELILTYPSEQFKKRLIPMAEQFNTEDLFYCNVAEEGSISALFDNIKKKYD